MLKRYLPFLLLVLTAVACDKGKLDSVPTIAFKNINGTEFPMDPNTATVPDLMMTVEYRDKEGDLGGGLITYIRNRLNIDPIENPAANDKIDTIRSILPEFPKTSTGEIQILVPGSFLVEDPNDNDTMTFSIFVQDVAGNTSDTIVSPMVVQRKN